MSEPSGGAARGPAEQRRRLGWGATVLGLVLVLWGVLHVTSAGFGTRPEREFAYRRSYNTVKRGVHEALPGGFVRALCGGLLLVAGARLRREKPGAGGN